ncbi:unnamed protein product, partial [Choristocarpus tenellus]
VQLGIAIPLEIPQEEILFRKVDWHSWDGGKAGGWPVRLCERWICLISRKRMTSFFVASLYGCTIVL